MKSDLPFEITPQIKRYLDELTEFSDNFIEGQRYIVDSYSGNEKPSYRATENMLRFFKYIQSEKLAECEESPVGVFIKYDDIENEGYVGHTKNWKVKVLGINSIRELRNKIEALSQTEKEKQIGNTRRLIYMDGEGDFTIGKLKDAIPFKSKKAGYYKVFVAIYKITSGAGGRASYKEIAEHIKKHFGRKKELTTKDIQNAINNSIKRLYLEERTPDGKEILSTDSERKAILFYNPRIE